jgi:zinc finger BED domain-containing protein 5/7/8/9
LETHLLDLQKQFYWYFPKDTIANTWILNPFVIDCSNLPPELSKTAQEELLTLSADIIQATTFKTTSLTEFWLNTQYNALKEIAVAMLLQFSTSYLCEKGFSSILFFKNKYRYRLDVELLIQR